MELDIAKSFREKLQARFDSVFANYEAKFTTDIALLEGMKYSFCDIDKEVNLNISNNLKDLEEERKIKKFNSSGMFDSKRSVKEDSRVDTDKGKSKKPEPKQRSKTPLSRNPATQSAVNLHEKAKSIKPVTDRGGKKINNLTTDDAFKTEKDSPKKKHGTTLNLIKETGTSKKLVKNSSVERIRDERKTKETTINKLKKDPVKKPNNLNKTQIISKKNLNISTDIKPVTGIQKDKQDVSEKSVKAETPRKDQVIEVKASGEEQKSIETLKNDAKPVSETVEIQPQIQKMKSEVLTDNSLKLDQINSNQTQKNESNSEKNETPSSSNTNTQTNLPVVVQKIEEIKPPKRLSIYLQNRSKLEDSSVVNNSRALRLFTLSGFCDIKKAIYINLLNKDTLHISGSTNKYILQSYGLSLNKEISHLYNMIKPYIEDPALNDTLNKVFTPSKTAINGLNFVNQTEEQNLLKKEQPSEIHNVFKLIYLLINEPYEGIEDNKLIENLLQNVLPRLKYDSLKTVFLSLSKTMTFTEKQIESMGKLFSENPKIISSPDLLKLNKCVSFMTFIIKEIFEFANLKSNDGQLLIRIKNQIAEYNKKREKLERLKKLLV